MYVRAPKTRHGAKSHECLAGGLRCWRQRQRGRLPAHAAYPSENQARVWTGSHPLLRRAVGLISHPLPFGVDPFIPALQSLAGCGGDLDDLDLGVNFSGIGNTAIEVEFEVWQQVYLVEQDHLRRLKHMRILQRLVLPLRHRQNRHLRSLTEIKERRTYEVANIFDHDDRADRRLELAHSTRDHVRVQMAPAARVDLHYWRASCMNSLTVMSGCLITFDDEKCVAVLQVANGALEQRRFARAGGTHEIESEDLAALKPGPVAYCERIVLLQNRLLQGDGRGCAVFANVMFMVVVTIAVMIMIMIVVMIMMVMVVPVDVKMMMVCNEDLFAGR